MEEYAHRARRALQRVQVARPAVGVVPRGGAEPVAQRPAAAFRAPFVPGPKPTASVISSPCPSPSRRVSPPCTTFPGVMASRRAPRRWPVLKARPRIARRSLVSARAAGQGGAGGHGTGGRVVPGHQGAAGAAGMVVVAVVTRRGIGQHVKLQWPPGERAEANPGEDGGPLGVGDPGLGDSPAPRGRGLAEGERAGHGLDARPHAGVGLPVGEGAAVGHGQLELAERGSAQVGVVDLVRSGDLSVKATLLRSSRAVP